MRMNLLLSVAVIAAVSGSMLPSEAYAQIAPPSLVDKVRSVVKPSSTAETSGINLQDALPTEQEMQLELERQAEIAAAQAAAQAKKKAIQHNKRSYKRAAQGLLPLSPDQVRTFMHKLEATQDAAQPPHAGSPKGLMKYQTLPLDPGTKAPVVYLAAGYVTTIDIIDQTGQPWPILDVGVGGNFEVTPTEAGSHVVRISPLTRYGQGNLSILLKDLPTPVIFKLHAGDSRYHMRFDARIPAYGPYAKVPLIRRGMTWPEAGGETISMILENAPPAKAQRLKISGLDARTKAWKVGAKVYVRTPLSMLSPSWNASASSSDGTTVYEIGDAPVLLMSDNGALIRARLLRDDNYDE